MKKIIDISTYQSNINWNKVKADGIDGVIVRAGYDLTEDKRFKEHINGAHKVGLPVGIYWFSYAYTDAMAKKEAKKCISIIKSYKIELPVYFDWEYDSMRYAKSQGKNPTRAQITSMNVAFCEEIKKAGYKPGVYYNYDYKNNHLNMDKLKSYSLWYAYYSSSVASGCDLQQYSSSGKVSGISGNVDVNHVINNKIFQTSKEETKKETTSKKTTISYPKLPSRGYFTSGDRGAEVKKLQTLLNKYKFNCGAVDGIYGPKTTAAVKAFQKKHKLVVDGLFGKNSLTQLKKLA